jgi:hypothetical protein
MRFLPLSSLMAALLTTLLAAPVAAQVQAIKKSLFTAPLSRVNLGYCQIVNTSSVTVHVSRFQILAVLGHVAGSSVTDQTPFTSNNCTANLGGVISIQAGSACRLTYAPYGGGGSTNYQHVVYCRAEHTGSDTAIVGNFQAMDVASSGGEKTVGVAVPLVLVNGPAAP